MKQYCGLAYYSLRKLAQALVDTRYATHFMRRKTNLRSSTDESSLIGIKMANGEAVLKHDFAYCS